MEEEFTDKQGRTIRLEFDDICGLDCIAYHGSEEVGRFSFNEWAPDEDSQILLMTHCHLSYVRSGIGEAILQMMKDYGYHVLARRHDGITRDDGSHLTEMAPGFVSVMVCKRLLSYTDGGVDERMWEGSDD